MIPALTLIVGCYVITRMLELIANEERSGTAKRTPLQVVATITTLITLGSCAAVQLTGSTIQSP